MKGAIAGAAAVLSGFGLASLFYRQQVEDAHGCADAWEKMCEDGGWRAFHEHQFEVLTELAKKAKAYVDMVYEGPLDGEEVALRDLCNAVTAVKEL